MSRSSQKFKTRFKGYFLPNGILNQEWMSLIGSTTNLLIKKKKIIIFDAKNSEAPRRAVPDAMSRVQRTKNVSLITKAKEFFNQIPIASKNEIPWFNTMLNTYTAGLLGRVFADSEENYDNEVRYINGGLGVDNLTSVILKKSFKIEYPTMVEKSFTYTFLESLPQYAVVLSNNRNYINGTGADITVNFFIEVHLKYHFKPAKNSQNDARWDPKTVQSHWDNGCFFTIFQCDYCIPVLTSECLASAAVPLMFGLDVPKNFLGYTPKAQSFQNKDIKVKAHKESLIEKLDQKYLRELEYDAYLL